MKRKNSLHDRVHACLAHSVSKDQTRPYLMGYIHYERLNALITCDGHKATIARSFYCDNLKNVIIDPNTMQAIDREYPRIESVIPSSKDFQLLTYKIEAHHYQKGKGKDVKKAYFCDNGEVILFEVPAGKKVLFALNAEFLKPLADGSEYHVKYFNDPLKPVLFDIGGTDAGFINTYLVMPIKL